MLTDCRLVFGVWLTALCALPGLAGNAANPDAIELAPLPMPVEFKSDMDKPVAFVATTTVTVDCPEAGAVDWLSRHFAEWYGPQTPKVVAGKTGLLPTTSSQLPTTNYQLPTNDEAYAINADASGVKIAARSLAGVRWAAYSLRQLAIAKRGTFKTEGRILPTLTMADHPHLAFRAVHLCWFPEVRPQQMERAIRLCVLTYQQVCWPKTSSPTVSRQPSRWLQSLSTAARTTI